MTIRRYLLCSTVLTLFSEAAYYHATFDVKAFYFVLLLNFIIIGFVAGIRVPRALAWVLAYLALSGFVGTLGGTDSLGASTAQLAGIAFVAIYYYNFFLIQGGDPQQPFAWYSRAAYWVCIIGLVMLPVQPLIRQDYTRLVSVFLEPAHFAAVVLPAFYFYADQFVATRRYGRETIVMATALVLTVSALAYLGLGLCVVMIGWRYPRFRWVAPIAVIAGILTATAFSGELYRRWHDSLGAIEQGTVENVNLSTYALFANAYVSYRAVQEHPLLGCGLGSHPLSHERYLAEVPGVLNFLARLPAGIAENAQDAASLVLRVTSELGALGLGLLAWFFVRFRTQGEAAHVRISNAVIIFFALKLLRDGHYFPPELYFFVFAYVFNRLHNESSRQTKAAAAAA